MSLGANTDDDRVEGQAFYGLLGYTFAKKLQPVVRIGYVDSDIDVDETRLWEYEGGLNYFAHGETLKVQAAYSYADADGDEPLQTATGAVQLKY